MSRFFESIHFLDGQLLNLPYHLKRMNKTVQRFYNLKQHFKTITTPVLVKYKKGNYKIRVEYNTAITTIDIQPYTPKRIQKLYLVEDNLASYAYKYTDRNWLKKHDALITANSDIIITKNGYLKEVSYANICLWNGRNWITPARPLHNGTKRQQLIQTKKVIVQQVHTRDLHKYKKVCLINAMLDLGEVEVDIKQLSVVSLL